MISAGSSETPLRANYIGTDVTGTVDLGNVYGVYLSATTDNTIGGTEVGARNVISGNDNYGVSVYSGSGNTVRGNSIYANSGLGIDLCSHGV